MLKIKKIKLNQRKFKSCAVGIVVASLALTLTYCGRSVIEGSNSSTSNDDAQARLDINVKKTNDLKLQLGSISHALEPVNAVLADVNKAVSLKINGKPANDLGSYLGKIQEVLKSASRGFAQVQDDGSWSVDVDSGLSTSSKCLANKIRITGKRIDDADQLDVYASKCVTGELEEVAKARVHSDGEIDFSLNDGGERHLKIPNLVFGGCSLKILASSKSEFSCTPSSSWLDSDHSYILSIDHMKIKNDSSGMYADSYIEVFHYTDSFKLVTEAAVQEIPNQVPIICVSTNDNDCPFSKFYPGTSKPQTLPHGDSDDSEAGSN
jgi:hypothetical protein